MEQQIIDRFANCDFTRLLNGDTCETKIIKQIDKLTYPFDYIIGRNKLVIKFFDLPYVIKIGFDPNFEILEVEQKLCNQMNADGYGKFICPVEVVTRIEGHPIAIQQRADAIGNAGTEYNSDWDEYRSWINADIIPNEICKWIADCVKQNGSEYVQDALKYINKNCSASLTPNNCAYTEDGKAVLIELVR